MISAPSWRIQIYIYTRVHFTSWIWNGVHWIFRKLHRWWRSTEDGIRINMLHSNRLCEAPTLTKGDSADVHIHFCRFSLWSHSSLTFLHRRIAGTVQPQCHHVHIRYACIGPFFHRPFSRQSIYTSADTHTKVYHFFYPFYFGKHKNSNMLFDKDRRSK